MVGRRSAERGVHVRVEDNRVTGVIVENASGRHIILAKTVVDATGHGDLAAAAGAEFEKGRPATAELIAAINRLAKDVPLTETFKGVIPFLVSDLLRITLLLFFPAERLQPGHWHDARLQEGERWKTRSSLGRDPQGLPRAGTCGGAA